MVVGILTFELFIPESGSLKTKRFAIRSIKDRLRTRFNVAVAELEGQDKWQRASLGVVAISNEAGHLEQIMDNVLKLVYGDDRVEVIDKTIQYV
jgi:hypothetical protein